MESRAAIDGSEINAYPLADGGYRVELAGLSETAAAGSLRLVQRHALFGRATTTVEPLLAARRRQSLSGTSGTGIDGSATVHRRRNFTGSTGLNSMAGCVELDVAVAATLTRRAHLTGRADVAISAFLQFSWRWLHRAPRRRVLVLEPDRRSILLEAHRRRMTVLPDYRRILVEPERREEA